VFLLAGSLQPGAGGAIVAHDTSLADLQTRVNGDPFVAEKVVSAEIMEITPARCDTRLAFLLDRAGPGVSDSPAASTANRPPGTAGRR
jgi:hypothetical protein